MHISVRVGCWEQHFVVGFDPSDEARLEEAGLTDGVSFIFDDDTIMIAADQDGVTLVDIREKEDGGEVYVEYSREFDFKGDPVEMGMVRFQMTELEGDLEEGSLMIHLPHPHKLPWFCSAGGHGRTDTQEICIREFEQRMISAVADGERRIHVPDHVKRHIPNNVWRDVVERARETIR